MNIFKLKKTIGLALCLAVLLVAGCTVESWELNLSAKACENHEGVNKFNTYWNFVVCNDGHKADIKLIGN